MNYKTIILLGGMLSVIAGSYLFVSMETKTLGNFFLILGVVMEVIAIFLFLRTIFMNRKR